MGKQMKRFKPSQETVIAAEPGGQTNIKGKSPHYLLQDLEACWFNILVLFGSCCSVPESKKPFVDFITLPITSTSNSDDPPLGVPHSSYLAQHKTEEEHSTF